MTNSLDPYRIRAIVKSIPIISAIPIKMEMEKSRAKGESRGGKEDAPTEYETCTENETL